MQKIIKALFSFTINRNDLKMTKNLSENLKIFLGSFVSDLKVQHIAFFSGSVGLLILLVRHTKSDTKIRAMRLEAPQSILAKTGIETMGDAFCSARSLQEVNRISEDIFHRLRDLLQDIKRDQVVSHGSELDSDLAFCEILLIKVDSTIYYRKTLPVNGKIVVF